MRPIFLPILVLMACSDTPSETDQNEAAAPATPQALYATRFVGDYGPQPICLGQEFIVSLLSTRVNIGETGCSIIGIEPAATADLQINLASCNAEGEPSFDRSIFVSATPDGGIVYQSTTSGQPEFLARCTDIN